MANKTKKTESEVEKATRRMEREKFQESLIDNVQPHTLLYIKSDFLYSDVGMKKKAWGKIAKVMNSTPEICEKEWKKLREAFRRERKARDYPSGSGTKKRKEFAFYDRMGWVEAHIAVRNTKCSEPNSETEESAVEIVLDDDVGFEVYQTQELDMPKVEPVDGDSEETYFSQATALLSRRDMTLDSTCSVLHETSQASTVSEVGLFGRDSMRSSTPTSGSGSPSPKRSSAFEPKVSPIKSTSPISSPKTPTTRKAGNGRSAARVVKRTSPRKQSKIQTPNKQAKTKSPSAKEWGRPAEELPDNFFALDVIEAHQGNAASFPEPMAFSSVKKEEPVGDDSEASPLDPSQLKNLPGTSVKEDQHCDIVTQMDVEENFETKDEKLESGYSVFPEPAVRSSPWCVDCWAPSTLCFDQHDVRNSKGVLRQCLQDAVPRVKQLLDGLLDGVQDDSALAALHVLRGVPGDTCTLTLRKDGEDDPLLLTMIAALAASGRLLQAPRTAHIVHRVQILDDGQ